MDLYSFITHTSNWYCSREYADRLLYYPLHAGTWHVYVRGLELKRTSDKINLCIDTQPLATHWVVMPAFIILVPVAVMVLLREVLYAFNWDLDFSSLRCRSEDAWKGVRETKEQSGKSSHIKFGSKTRVIGGGRGARYGWLTFLSKYENKSKKDTWRN